MYESADIRVPAGLEGERMAQIGRKNGSRWVKHVIWNGDVRRMRNRDKGRVYRQVKDRLFCFLFGKNKDALL